MQLLSTWFSFRLKSYLSPGSSAWRKKGAEESGITLGDDQHTGTKEEPSPDTGTPWTPAESLTRTQAGWRQGAYRTCPHSSQRSTGFPGLYQDIWATSRWDSYEIRNTKKTIPLSGVTSQASTRCGKSQSGNQEKKNAPSSRSCERASWYSLSALLEGQAHCYCLGFLRVERDNNSCLYWGKKSLCCMYGTAAGSGGVCGTVRVPHTTQRGIDIGGKSRDNIRSGDHSKLLHCCFRVLPFFRSRYQYFFFHLTMLAFCCNTFLMALALFFSMNSFAHIHLLHLH